MNSAVSVLPVPHAMIICPRSADGEAPSTARDRLALMRSGPFALEASPAGGPTGIDGQSTWAARRSASSSEPAGFSWACSVRSAVFPIRSVVAISRRKANSGRADSDKNVSTSAFVTLYAGSYALA